jgi:hypothetical protein
MQKQKYMDERQEKGVRSATIGVFVFGVLNIVVACIELAAFWPRQHWTVVFVDAIIDLGLSLLLVLMGGLIYRKNRWGWACAVGLLGFLMINQIAIGSSMALGNVWGVLTILWAVAEGIFLAFLRFNRSIRSQLTPGYLLQPVNKR